MPISQSRMIALIRAAEAYVYAYESLVEAIETARYMPAPEAQVHVLTALAAYSIPPKANGTIRVESYHFKKFERANKRNADRMARERDTREAPKRKRPRYAPPQSSDLAVLAERWEAEPTEAIQIAEPPALVLDPNPQFTEKELTLLLAVQAHVRAHQPVPPAELLGWLLERMESDRLFELIERAKAEGLLAQDASGQYTSA